MPGGRKRSHEEEADAGESTEDDEEMVAKPRARRAAAKVDYRDDDDGGGGDDDDEEEGGGRGRGAKRGRQRAAPQRRRSAGSAASQSFCTSQVETDFAYSQADVEAFVADAAESQETLRPQDEKTYDNMGTDARKKLLADVVRYILFKGSRREAIVRTKLNSDVINKHGKGLAKAAVKDARDVLKKTFGYDLVSVPKSKANTSDALYLVNTVRKAALSRDLNSYGKDVGYRGLVMVVLGLIFCANDRIQERVLFSQLAELDGTLQSHAKGGGKDSEFEIVGEMQGVGDVGEAFEKMRREQYVVRDRDPDAEDENGAQPYVYSMGPRALVEVGRKQVLRFIAETMGQEPDPSMVREIEQRDEQDRRRREQEEQA